MDKLPNETWISFCNRHYKESKLKNPEHKYSDTLKVCSALWKDKK